MDGKSNEKKLFIVHFMSSCLARGTQDFQVLQLWG